MRALIRLTVACLLTASAMIPGQRTANWTANYSPCDGYSELLNKTRLNLGVRFSTSNPQLAAECARALDFWATVLDMEWHEDDSRSCAIQIVDGRRDLFIPGQLARSQLPERFGFQGWIAFNPRSSLPANEQFFVAVHELGHVLGLPHNSSASSIMFYLNVDEPFVLDSADLRALAARHKLRVDRLDQPLMVTPRAVPAVDPRAGRQLNAGPAFAAAPMHLQGVLSYERRSYDVNSRDSLCRSASLLLGSAAQSQTAGRGRIIVLIGPTGGGKSTQAEFLKSVLESRSSRWTSGFRLVWQRSRNFADKGSLRGHRN